MKTETLANVRAHFAALTEKQDSALSVEFDSALSHLLTYGQCDKPKSDQIGDWLAKRNSLVTTSETAKIKTLTSHLFRFILARQASGIAANQIRRFQERREGMTRKASGNGKAVWSPKTREKLDSGKDSLSALVSDDTRAEMEDAALCALGARIAECPLDFEGIKAAHRAACLVLTRHMRQHKREAATAEEIETAQKEADFLAQAESVNGELISNRALAIQDASERILSALRAHWEASGSRKAKAGFAGDSAIVSLALKVTLEQEGADDWHNRQTTRTAIFKRLAAFHANVANGFRLLGESPDYLKTIYGEHDERAEKIAPAFMLPLRATFAPREQVTISRTITKADKQAMHHVARSQRQSVRECEQGAWKL